MALAEACGKVDLLVGKVGDFSSVYETEPWGFESKKRFYNQVLSVKTSLLPEEILRITRGIEHQLGRKESGTGYADRYIDIDILFYDDLIIAEEKLVIPHPLLQERDFVLWPLAEIDSGFIHPVLKQSIDELKKLLHTERTIKKAVSKSTFLKKWQTFQPTNY